MFFSEAVNVTVTIACTSILFYGLCPIWLFCDTLSCWCPVAARGAYISQLIFLCVTLSFLITASDSFQYLTYDYQWDVYAHGHSYWHTGLGCLNLGNISFISGPGSSFSMLECICMRRTHSLYSQPWYSTGKFHAFNWMPLRCLVPWINNLAFFILLRLTDT